MHSTIVTAAAIAGLLLPLTGQDPTGQDPGNQDPALRDVPAAAPNVLVVRDVMPHLEAVLRSPALRDAATATADLQQELFGMRLDPASLERQVNLLSSFVPRHVELACSEDFCTSIAHLLHAMTALAIGEAAADEDRLRMGPEVQAALQAIVAPTGVLRVTARDERTAEQWFDQLLGLIEGLRHESLTAEVGDARVDLTWRPFVEPNGNFDRRLRRLQVETKALEGLAIKASLSQSQAVLTLRLGEFAGTDLGSDRLGELFRRDDGQLLFATLECTEALEIGYRSLDLLLQTELQQDSAMVMQLYAMVDQLTNLANKTDLAFDLGDGATWTLLADYGDEPFMLDRPEPEVVRCIDPALGPFTLSALTLDLMLSATGDEIYNRVLQRADRIDADEAFAMLDRFQGLFDYVDGEDSAVFLPGTAFVMAPSSFRGLHRTRQGGGTVELLPGLPFGAVAIVAKAESAAAANTFVDTMVARSCEGMQVPGDVLVEVDLALGVPTRRIAFERWLPADIRIDADFDPHHAQLGEVMILSTDAALTRQLLARLRASKAPRLPIENPLEWSRWTGAHVATVVDGLAAWLHAMPPSALGTQQLASMCRAIATLSKSIESLETLSVLEDDRRLRETTTMKLRQGK